MKIVETKIEEHTVEHLHSMKCDYCYEIYDQEFEMQEFVSISFTGGYGSCIGDGTKVELDLCQKCFKHLFKNYYRTKEIW